MALTKDQKQLVVSDISALLEESKLTVVAKYTGTTVKEVQELRRNASNSNTKRQVKAKARKTRTRVSRESVRATCSRSRI